MSDRDTQCLPGTFGPGAMVLGGDRHVVGMRWQTLVKISGRGWPTVEGSSKEDVLGGIVINDLVAPAGRGWTGREELGEGRVVN